MGRFFLLAAGIFSAVAGGLIACGDDGGSDSCGELTCPEEMACAPSMDECVYPEQLSACEGLAEEDSCSYLGLSGLCLGQVCRRVGCGSGSLDDGEVCDDGNNLSGDGCAADCRSDETCGNGITDPQVGEACDDGNNDSGDGCQSGCILPICGDGIIDVERNESCDCGDDGVANEDCDTPNSDEPNASCRSNCLLQRCGDQIIDNDFGETCDDGNNLAGDGCSPGCTIE